MRFLRISTTSFGALQELDTGPDALPRLVVVEGRNEAGKSTFFELLATILYGFYPASRESHPYAPWSGAVADTRAKQLSLWGDLILSYCRAHKIFELDVAEAASNKRSPAYALFHNDAIDRSLDAERLVADQAAKRLVAHQLYDDEGHTVLLADVVDRGDVGVIERSREPRHLMESRATLRVSSQLWRQDLEGDIAIESRVGRLVDHTHPALADLLDQTVVKELLSRFDGHSSVLAG